MFGHTLTSLGFRGRPSTSDVDAKEPPMSARGVPGEGKLFRKPPTSSADSAPSRGRLSTSEMPDCWQDMQVGGADQQPEAWAERGMGSFSMHSWGEEGFSGMATLAEDGDNFAAKSFALQSFVGSGRKSVRGGEAPSPGVELMQVQLQVMKAEQVVTASIDDPCGDVPAIISASLTIKVGEFRQRAAEILGMPPGRLTLATANSGRLLQDGSLLCEAIDGRPVGTLSLRVQYGASAVTSGLDATVRLWCLESGAQMQQLDGHKEAVTGTEVSPDGEFLVTASRDSTAKIWSANSGELRGTLEGHLQAVQSAAFSSDGLLAATSSFDRTAKIWDVSTCKCLQTIIHGSSVRSAVLNRNSTLVLTAAGDCVARIWRFKKKALASLSSGGGASLPESLDAFLGDEEGANSPSRPTQSDVVRTFEGHGGAAWSAYFSKDEGSLLTASSDKTAKLWDTETGANVVTFQGHSGIVWSAVFGGEVGEGQRSTLIATASGDRSARLWDARTGDQVSRFEGHDDAVRSVRASPDGELLLTCSQDGTAKLWSIASQRCSHTLQGHVGGLSTAVFSP